MTHHHPFDRIAGVDVTLSVELGRARVALRDLLALAEGSVVALDRHADDLLDLYANQTLIARGEVVSQGDRFALRIVELASDDGLPVVEQAA